MLVAAAALPLLASVAVALTPDIAAADGPVAIVGRTPTKLVAAPISVVHTVTSVRLTYSARLTVTATGAPIANQFILFSDVAVIPGPSPLRNLLCETQTNSNGVARCTVNILGVLNVLEKPAYRATYFGNDTYFPAVGTGVVGP
jgi:hypothetical protein